MLLANAMVTSRKPPLEAVSTCSNDKSETDQSKK